MTEQRPTPVYIFTGFLDSGKTKFINDTLQSPEFVAGKNTLLVVCEEGEEEYDPTMFASENVYTVTIEDEDDLSPELLASAAEGRGIDQVMVEYNGMWALDNLYRNLPSNWGVVQEFAFFDATTILTYNANMRTQVVDKLQSCDLAVFNRVGDDEDIMPFHKLVRAVSRGADIVYERKSGKVERDEIVDPLPFDVNAPIIEIADTDFALWYRDMGENLAQYDGKTVKFKGMVVKNPKLKQNEMVVGRKIMTCCIDDTTFSGLVCSYNGAPFFENEAWVNITAKIELKKHPLYQNKGPVLNVTEAARTDAPEVEVVTFA
jgi:hypothetical protein